jgi:hypothetical protein
LFADSDIPAARLRELAEELHDPGGAKRNVPAATVTLKLDNVKIWDAFREIEKQTGNKCVDWRLEQGGEATAANARVSCDFKDTPFWVAVDELLDGAVLDVHGQSGSDALAIVPRGRGGVERSGRAAYDGPFRIEALDIHVQRNLRQPEDSGLMLQLQIAWEPRLRPIALTQKAADLEASVGDIASLTPQHPDAVYNAEVASGSQTVDMVLPFKLPPRTAPAISSLRGKLWALVPGRQAKFQFEKLAEAAGKSQRDADVEIIVDKVFKNDEIWELHMRMKLADSNHALESHRGWAFENRSYLVDAKGEVLENAGLETISEDEQEIGVAYFFDAPDGLDGFSWVYETPVDMAETEVDYELRDIELP